MHHIKNLLRSLQNLTGTPKYIAWSLTGLGAGVVLGVFPGFPFGPVWVLPAMGFLLGVSEASQSERKRKHPKPPPPLGPPTRRSPF